MQLLRSIIYFGTILSLFISIIWFLNERGFESSLAVLGLILTLVTLLISDNGRDFSRLMAWVNRLSKGLILVFGIFVGASVTVAILTFHRQTLAIEPTTTSSVDCVCPEVLANREGWEILGFGDLNAGGLIVKLNEPAQLPFLWSAFPRADHTKNIDSYFMPRDMYPAEWVIYTPFICREELGFDPPES